MWVVVVVLVSLGATVCGVGTLASPSASAPQTMESGSGTCRPEPRYEELSGKIRDEIDWLGTVPIGTRAVLPQATLVRIEPHLWHLVTDSDSPVGINLTCHDPLVCAFTLDQLAICRHGYRHLRGRTVRGLWQPDFSS
jgi:hypothetical protein